ncbi:hypothetical protein V5O48_009639 [Marasmius crinis-equi]|uniref:Peptidase A1 domain-containing protein n=1 Tax=Marasmius crinis-equi TaxID=585013 RepID=A0ABR3FAQ4_9AGAR
MASFTSLRPPFTLATALKKVKVAQDVWNTRTPSKVAMAYTPNTIWRNRDKFLSGREEVTQFLEEKWRREHGYMLRKDLFAFQDNKIAVQFFYEWNTQPDLKGQWHRCYGLEDWTYEESGLMRKRMMSGNDVVISDAERWFKPGVDIESTRDLVHTTTLKPLKGRNRNERRETVPVSVVYQQHVNKAIRRLSLATGRVQPSETKAVTPRVRKLREKRLNRIGIPDLSKSAGRIAMTKDREAAGVTGLVAAIEDVPEPVNDDGHSVELQIEETDIGYFFEMSLGTPPRPFKLLADTGSADVWVAGENCHGDNEAVPGCGPHTSIGSNSSSTFRGSNEGFLIFYVSGYAIGKMATDTSSVAGLTVENFRFGAATKASESIISSRIPWDGIFGLGQPALARQPNVTSFIDALKNNGQISEPIVSFKIPRYLDSEEEDSEGEMTIGGLNPDKFDEDTLVTVKNLNANGFWEAPIDSLNINGVEMEWVRNNRSGVLDTGTTLLVVPPSDAKAIHDSITGAQFDSKLKQWTVPCASNVTMTVSFGNRSFPIDPRDMRFDIPINETTCYSGIAQGELNLGDTVWLVGDTILKNVYLSLNRATDEISLAQLKD